MREAFTTKNSFLRVFNLKQAIWWSVPTFVLLVTLSFAAEADLSNKRVPAEKLKEIQALKNPFEASPENISKGKVLYQTQATCFTCHGKEGRGDGLAAPGLDPSPRNFTSAGFHSMRTDGELFWVIKKGIPGTAMMPMVGSVITEEEAWLVLLYERSLGRR